MNLRFYDMDQIPQPNLMVSNTVHTQLHFAVQERSKAIILNIGLHLLYKSLNFQAILHTSICADR